MLQRHLVLFQIVCFRKEEVNNQKGAKKKLTHFDSGSKYIFLFVHKVVQM